MIQFLEDQSWYYPGIENDQFPCDFQFANISDSYKPVYSFICPIQIKNQRLTVKLSPNVKCMIQQGNGIQLQRVHFPEMYNGYYIKNRKSPDEIEEGYTWVPTKIVNQCKKNKSQKPKTK